MNNRFSELFIRRPVATTLLTIGIALAGAARLHPAAGVAAAAGRFPDDLGVRRSMPGASPDTMATLGRRAARAPSRPDRRRHRDDLDELARHDAHHAAVRPRPRHRRRGARRAGGDQRRPRRPADQPAHQPDLSQDQSRRRADHGAGADLDHAAPRGQIYDIASNVLQQRLSQLDGIGEVDVGGSALPAVRVELDPGALFKYGIGLEDIRAALAAANANSPKGAVEDDDFHYQIYANDQATKADQYRDLVVAYRNNAAVKLVRRRRGRRFGRGPAQRRPFQRQAVGRHRAVAPARRQHHPGGRRRQSRAAAPRRRRCRATSTSTSSSTARSPSAARSPTPSARW